MLTIVCQTGSLTILRFQDKVIPMLIVDSFIYMRKSMGKSINTRLLGSKSSRTRILHQCAVYSIFISKAHTAFGPPAAISAISALSGHGGVTHGLCIDKLRAYKEVSHEH